MFTIRAIGTNISKRAVEKLPSSIVMKLGPILFMAPEMIERVRGAIEKQQGR